MIAAEPHRSGIRKEAHAQGWLISVLLHSTVALAGILLVKQVQLAPQDEAFKWNVALVLPTQHVQSTASAPSSAAQQTPPAQTLSPPQRLAPQTTPSISERTATAMVTEPPPPQLTIPSPSAAHTKQPAEPIRHETISPMASETAPILQPAETLMAVSSSTDAVTGPSSAQSTTHEQTPQSEQASAQIQVAAISPAPSYVPAKRDYGWLSEAVLRRVEELKRYPASARVDRAEGKVVVKAVINEDGNLGEVEVFQSSGHPSLDKAAIETMRQAAPFHLPRPLGQPRMTIKIAMSYRLDR